MMMAAAAMAMMAGIGPIYLVPWNRGLKKELGSADLGQSGNSILKKTKLWKLIAHDRIVLE